MEEEVEYAKTQLKIIDRQIKTFIGDSKLIETQLENQLHEKDVLDRTYRSGQTEEGRLNNDISEIIKEIANSEKALESFQDLIAEKIQRKRKIQDMIVNSSGSGNISGSIMFPGGVHKANVKLPNNLPYFRDTTKSWSITRPQDFLRAFKDELEGANIPSDMWTGALIKQCNMVDREWVRRNIKAWVCTWKHGKGIHLSLWRCNR